jgi:hypothetical protein
MKENERFLCRTCAWKAVLTLKLKKEKKDGINPDTGIKAVRGDFQSGL